MIIVTGMDNTGKTTLVNRMSQALGVIPIVKSPGPNLSRDEKHLWILDQMTREKAFPDSVIFDRFLPFEEMVYGEVLRGETIYSLKDPYLKSLKALNPNIIYTRPPSKTIFNFGDREQMPGVIEQKNRLLAAWDDLMWKLITQGWQVMVYDYTTDPEAKSIIKKGE